MHLFIVCLSFVWKIGPNHPDRPKCVKSVKDDVRCGVCKVVYTKDDEVGQGYLKVSLM